jgi:hypothetical protein
MPMILSILLIDVCKKKDFLDNSSIHLGVIQIPFLKQLIHLTNDSVHCIDHRQLDTLAILTM